MKKQKRKTHHPVVFTWNGRPITDLTRAELIMAYEELAVLFDGALVAWARVLEKIGYGRK